ncbi:MAG: VanZ family protein [Eubacterium sp.]|nr:VanZ family protein [Eubacterium sp.]MCM1217417.1 VanZ family protein [Lachnospiraceae bacterium]MCM1305496.1 VanZ family protein [Butyrivibrio sp.]MCM1344329.1 VanZ family protein [Muribaculaceae bacterium]MCM1238611.1 VanZ family protein [Lachnospiraceae bacterium]
MLRKTSRKVMISTGAGILLAVLYVIIFNFSAQDAEQSGSLSRIISEKWVEMINTLANRQWSQAVMEEWIVYFEHPIRKLAHFTEYACMGVLVYVLWSQWLERGKRLYLLTIAWVALSAAADEFHQRFVPGRSGNLADVCLDTCGGAAGMLFCVLVWKIFLKNRHGS